MEIAFLNGLNWNLQSDLAEFEHVMEKVETEWVFLELTLFLETYEKFSEGSSADWLID